MRVTVLGKSPAWQDAGGACSGYLVQEGDTRLLLDCGNGVFAKLRRASTTSTSTRSSISHMHADHFLDLVPFAYALTLRAAPAAGAGRRLPGTDAPARPQLLVPRGGVEVLRRVGGAWGSEDARRERVRHAASTTRRRRSRSATLRDPLRAGPALPADLRGRGRAAGRRRPRFTYGADCAPNERARRVRARHRPADDRGDAAAPGARRDPRPPDAAEAGEHARRARGAARLVHHAHLRRARRDRWARREAEEAFGGSVAGRRRGRRLRGLTGAGRSCGRRRSTLGSYDGRTRARSVRELRAHAPRDGRAVRRRLRPHGLAPRRRGGFSPAVDVFYEGDPPRAVVHAELAGIEPTRSALAGRGPRPDHRRPPPPGRGRGPRLPAAGDRLRAVPPRDPARRRRRRRRRRSATYRDGILRVELPLVQEPRAARCASVRDRDPRATDGPVIHVDRRRRRARRSRSARRARCPATLPVLPLRETRPAARHADAARRRPGALGPARQRRARRRPHARHGRLARSRARDARPRASSTTSASSARSRAC